jgi:divalent metal cation (Fe/Co/Zn/Cd) transporter
LARESRSPNLSGSVAGLTWLVLVDPAVALVIAAVIGYRALSLVWKVVTAIKSSEAKRSGPTADSEL